MQKKSKKMIALTAAAFCMMTAGYAQSELRTIAVQVDLRDVTGVSPVTPTGAATVGFIYQTADDYNNLKSTDITNQFRVTSTKAYSIVVRGSGDFAGSGSNTLPLDILRVSTKATGGGTFGTEVTPTTSNQTLLTGAAATLDQGYDVRYSIPQNPALLTATKEVYNTNIIYSATAP